MKISVECSCGQRYDTEDSPGGRRFLCAACRRTIQVPPSLFVADERCPETVLIPPPRRSLPLRWIAGAAAVGAATVLLLSLASETPRAPWPEPTPSVSESTEPVDWPPATLPASVAPSPLPPDEPPATRPPTARPVAPVLRDNRGVQVTKDRKSGAKQLIVDPFPDEKRPEAAKAPAKSKPSQGR